MKTLYKNLFTCVSCMEQYLLENTTCQSCGQDFCSTCVQWWGEGFDYCYSCQEHDNKQQQQQLEEQ